MKKHGAPPDPLDDTFARLHAEDMARINADPEKVAGLKALKELKDKQPVYPLPITVLQDAEEQFRKDQRAADSERSEARATHQMHLKPALYAQGIKEVRKARQTAPMLDRELDEARKAAIEADKAKPDVAVRLPEGRRDAPTELGLVKRPIVVQAKPVQREEPTPVADEHLETTAPHDAPIAETSSLESAGVSAEAIPVSSPHANPTRAEPESGGVLASRAQEKPARSVFVPIALALVVLVGGSLLWWKTRADNGEAASTRQSTSPDVATARATTETTSTATAHAVPPPTETVEAPVTSPSSATPLSVHSAPPRSSEEPSGKPAGSARPPAPPVTAVQTAPVSPPPHPSSSTNIF